MKRLLIIITFIASLQSVVAQNTIKGYEYWFNNELSQKVSSEISPTEMFLFDENISTSELQAGLHQFNIRFIDSDDCWSSVLNHIFYKLPIELNTEDQAHITQYEYWINDDYENAIRLNTESQEIIQLDELISMNDYTPGLYRFNIRFKDSNGYWSSILTNHFYKLPSIETGDQAHITQYEYWINDDYENAIRLNTESQEIIQLDELISMNDYNQGLYRLNIRFEDNNGYWSSVLTQVFYKNAVEALIIDSKITDYRYWFDDDFDNLYSFQLEEAQELFDWIENLPMPYEMFAGNHFMYVQFKDSKNLWSSPLEFNFEKNLDPRGEIFANNYSICGKEFITFYSNAVDVDYIEWNLGDGSPIITRSYDKSIKHNYQAEGEYTISAVLVHEESETQLEREILINVFPDYGEAENIIYFDDFEEYELDTFPNDWVIRYNGTGDANQKIVIDPENENNKVFSLSGTSSWAANLSYYIDEFPLQFSLETKMFTQGIGDIRIGNPSIGSWGAYLGGVQYYNGSFRCTNHSGFDAGVIYVFENLEPSSWYTVRLDFNFTTLTYKVFLDDEQLTGINDGIEYDEFPIVDNVEPLSIELSSNSSMLYDDVKLFIPDANIYPKIEASLAICSNELPYEFGTQLLTDEGFYTELFQTTNSCDSLVTLDFTILEESYTIDEIIACDFYEWIDGNTYTESTNEPSFTLINQAGCDSVVTLNLTINYSDDTIDEIIACDFYEWIDGNIYTESTNEPVFIFTNQLGCDSVVTLNLTINYSDETIDEIIACDFYEWIDGNTYTESTNEPVFTLTNQFGCDSVVTLNLTINPLPDSSVTQNENTLTANQDHASYQWLDCNNDYAIIEGETEQSFVATENGSYAVEIVKDGCSIISDCHAVTNISVEAYQLNQIIVYPNPNDGKFTIDLGKVFEAIS
ncbi:MAG: hypothetical protein GX879_00705, partial [Bacteroidales bacterium]|nr:hypothetical protein [Bacteroidales bacterium]